MACKLIFLYEYRELETVDPGYSEESFGETLKRRRGYGDSRK